MLFIYLYLFYPFLFPNNHTFTEQFEMCVVTLTMATFIGDILPEEETCMKCNKHQIIESFPEIYYLFKEIVLIH